MLARSLADRLGNRGSMSLLSNRSISSLLLNNSHRWKQAPIIRNITSTSKRTFLSGTHGESNGRLLALATLIATLAGTVALAGMSFNESSCSAKEYSLYPEIRAYEEGNLSVGNDHVIYYGLYGNPKGKPVLFVHGGPGGGTYPGMAQYFDPKVYKIILVDQRGCGKSVPLGSLEHNTTQDLINDFEKLRIHLKIDKWLLFGGSWGSTLSLAYSIQHPERVKGMILRGIFLCRQKELQWLYEGQGANFIFPEDWERYTSIIPENERSNFISAYNKRILGHLGRSEQIRAAKQWTTWEARICSFIQEPLENIGKYYSLDSTIAFAAIESHYFQNKGFFPTDDYLLDRNNLKKLRPIPTIIIQGRYDIVCPPISAYELWKGLPHAEFWYAHRAGHVPADEEMIELLVKATEEFKSL